ncbi:hypothetical protein [Entomobacter blattae]|uniref:Uncharacterized protein n=1 Tax=Entomobacter blattae TaxID=2762277 RepID=A0A7H1NQE9_9PROT|nr:hypothetical protein [Entomobacter blattae]QNT78009.1 hypothetical protein JGUZn3_07760 [Entomobacter blattae]
MASTYVLSGSDQLNLDATAWNESTANVNVNSARQGSLSIHNTASAVLNVTGSASSTLSIETGQSSLSTVTVSGLGASAFLVAGQGTVYSYGDSSTNQFRIFADGNSHSASSNLFNITEQNTLLVMNGATYPTTANIYDLGGNQTWVGNGQYINYYLNSVPENSTIRNPGADSQLVAGSTTATFNINGPNNTGTTLHHLDVILNAINSSTNTYNITTNALTGTTPQVNIFQSAGTLNFTGNNAIVVYNNPGNQTFANLNFTGNDQAYTGNQSSVININGGNNSVVVGGVGSVTINGSNNATLNYGQTFIGSSEAGSGAIIYHGGTENVQISTAARNSLTATLGSGSADIDLKPLYNASFDITVGTGNTILRNFTQSQATNGAASQFKLHLENGQNIVNTQITGGNTIYTLNSGNLITLAGWTQNGQNPFS